MEISVQVLSPGSPARSDGVRLAFGISHLSAIPDGRSFGRSDVLSCLPAYLPACLRFTS